MALAAETVRNRVFNPRSVTTAIQIIRQNLATNPLALSTGAAHSVSAGTGVYSTSSPPSGYSSFYRCTPAASTAEHMAIAPVAAGSVPAGVRVTGGAWVRCAVATTVALKARLNSGTADTVYQLASVALAANTWTWVSGVSTADTAAAMAGSASIYASHSLNNTAALIDITGEMLVVGTASLASTDAFSGSTAAAGVYTYDWVGTANASMSNMRAPVATYTGATRPTAPVTFSPVRMVEGARTFSRIKAESAGTHALLLNDAGLAAPAGTVVSGGCFVRSSRAQTVSPRVGGQAAGSGVAVAANTWTWLPVTATLDSTRNLRLEPTITAVVGDLLDATEALLVLGSYAGGFFDGETVDAPPLLYTWDGAPNNAQSVIQNYSPPALTATVDLNYRSVQLLATGLADATLITIRRQTDGYPLTLVRAARAAAAVGGQLFAYDHEPPLSLPTTYQARAHFADGSVTAWSAGTTVTVPAEWNEVWLKDVGQPLRSLRVILRRLSARERDARDETHSIQDSPYPLVVSGVRAAAVEQALLGTLTDNDRKKMDAILSSGQVLLFQTPPGWGRTDAFVSIGRSRENRVREWGPHPYRDWELQLTETTEPGSDRTGLPSNSYAIVAATYGSYGGLLASRKSYLAVLAGTNAV